MPRRNRVAHRNFNFDTDQESKTENPSLSGGLLDAGVTESDESNAWQTEIFVSRVAWHADVEKEGGDEDGDGWG